MLRLNKGNALANPHIIDYQPEETADNLLDMIVSESVKLIELCQSVM